MILLVVFVCGVFCWPMSKMLLRKLSGSASSEKEKSRIYGLEHGVLNLEMPSTMWMNMGYWKDQLNDPQDFPGACRALLDIVLESALRYQDSRPSSNKICLVDVGFGCGDQSLHLLHHESKPGQPTIGQYLGLTNVSTQYACADRRLKDRMNREPDDTRDRYGVHCEDAAMPSQWSTAVKESLRSLQTRSKSRSEPIWLLALDTIYHFKPSREPLLKYANLELHASFMAFDLLLADGVRAPTMMQRLILRLICLLTSTPHANFLTVKQYRQMLMNIGYDNEAIDIEDITPYVFEPLTRFMRHHDSQLRTIGLGIGALRAAMWMFSWWARSGIVRGCVVVARHTKS